MNKKILFIIFWDLELGGIQKRIRDIVFDIVNTRPSWTVYVLLRRQTGVFFIHQLPIHDRLIISIYPLQRKAFKIPGGFLFWIAYKWICLRPQSVLTFLPPLSLSIIAMKKILFWIKTKVIVNDGVYLTNFLKIRNQTWLKFIIAYLYKFADTIIVPTHACKSDVAKNYLHQGNTITVIPSWTLYRSYKSLKKKYDLIYIGRYEAEKNPQLFLDIVHFLQKKNYPISAVMIGSGSLYASLKRRIHSAGLTKNVRLYQFKSDVSRFLRQSKILVLPSHNEGMPNTALEAAMCRVPTVANNFSGADEVILKGKTGFITGNKHEMITKIRLLLYNPIFLTKIGIQAQKYVRQNFHHKRQKEFISLVLGETDAKKS